MDRYTPNQYFMIVTSWLRRLEDRFITRQTTCIEFPMKFLRFLLIALLCYLLAVMLSPLDPTLVVVNFAVLLGVSWLMSKFSTAADEPYASLRAKNLRGCEAIVCGGDDGDESNCLADKVFGALNQNDIDVVGVSSSSACGVSPNGGWYEK